jgi:hypothetical protein
VDGRREGCGLNRLDVEECLIDLIDPVVVGVSDINESMPVPAPLLSVLSLSLLFILSGLAHSIVDRIDDCSI